jgi:hypothetical protein
MLLVEAEVHLIILLLIAAVPAAEEVSVHHRQHQEFIILVQAGQAVRDTQEEQEQIIQPGQGRAAGVAPAVLVMIAGRLILALPEMVVREKLIQLLDHQSIMLEEAEVVHTHLVVTSLAMAGMVVAVMDLIARLAAQAQQTAEAEEVGARILLMVAQEDRA